PDEPDEEEPDDEELEELRDGADEGGGEYDGAGRDTDSGLLAGRSDPLDRPEPDDEPDEDPEDGRPKRSGSDHDRDSVDCCREVARARPVGAAGRAVVPDDEGARPELPGRTVVPDDDGARPAVPGAYVEPEALAPLRPD
ncbi:MAG: hypothetical protein AABY75_01180, partial [Bacteroidota bacterium]